MNVSQQRREESIKRIKEIRDFISHSAQDENAGRLLTYLSELEKEIKGKKYGLVFEEHREKIDETLEKNAPVLTEQEDLYIDNGGQMNFLIEGDNLAALELLLKTHRGKIDIIYIDPPYNTGKEFVYNDNIIDIHDTYRHSKWLSFIKERLILAKKLLANTGVIFISIDDNEYAQLKVLSDSIFSESNFITNFCVIRAEGGGLAKQVVKGHDYCLVYAKNISKFTPLARPKDIRGKIIEKKGIKYWIQEDWLRKEFGKYGNCHYEEIEEIKGLDFKKEIDKGIKQGNYILISKPNGLHIVGRLKQVDLDCSKFYSIIKHLNKNGVNELQELDIDFNYPKPVSLIYELIHGASFFKKRTTVLDFFAGSGTTGHAVLKLNAEDGGARRFILCTNNENNICRDITYERIKRVIDKEDYAASLKYFKIDFVPISERLYYEYADELLLHIRELVELENGVNFRNNSEIAIVLTDEELDAFMENRSALKACRALYVGHDVLINGRQSAALKRRKIAVNVIPQYYYEES